MNLIQGGCITNPTALNAKTRCAKSKICWISCLKFHTYPDETKKSLVKCINNQWINVKTQTVWKDMECQLAKCEPKCKEDEVCVSSNKCEPRENDDLNLVRSNNF